MQTIKYVYWQEEGMWLGYLEEFPTTGRRGKPMSSWKRTCATCIAMGTTVHLLSLVCT
jgi:hypothetical protein